MRLKIISIYEIILLVAFLLFAVWRITSSRYEAKNLYRKLSKEYPKLTFEDSLNNIVKRTYYPAEWRGKDYFQFVTFENNSKYEISINRRVTSKDIYFGAIVRSGAKIQKKANSDTISVILQNGRVYKFTIYGK